MGLIYIFGGNNMKILGIIGSMRTGNTYLMVMSTKEIFKENDIHFETVHLKDLSFNFCNGCLKCDNTGVCYQDDDLNSIVEKIKEADGFIFATPTRWSLLSGEMKTFLDRLNPLAMSELLSGKKAVVFAVGQTNKESNNVYSAANSIIEFCKNANIDVIDTVLAYECLNNDDVLNKIDVLENCKLAVKKLINILQ